MFLKEKPSQKPYTAPRREIWGWGCGRVAEFSLVAMFGQAMNIFSVGFGLNPVILSWCMMLPRLVDGIVDPIIGHWSDNCHSKWGRRKPFLFAGAVAGALFLAVLWWANPSWPPVVQFLFLGIVGMCLYLCYGTYTMAWNAIGYELSDDYHERSRIQAVSGFFLAGMLLLNSWVYWLALRPVFGGVVGGMRWIGLMVALLVVGSALVALFSTKERFSESNRTHVSLLPALRATLRNKPFVVLLLMKLFEVFGGRLTSGVLFFLTIYYVCRGDQDLGTRLAGIAATLGAIWSFAVLPFVKSVSIWLGKRGALIVGAGCNFAAALASPFLTTPEHPYWSLVPALVITPVLGLSAIIANAIVPDICDLDELRSGQRREGLFTSVMAFVSKIEISLAVMLVGYLVAWSGVDTGISLRWRDAAEAHGGSRFSAGEKGVFALPAGGPATFDGLALRGDVQAVELFVSDESPTAGFRSLGKFSLNQAGGQRWVLPPVTAKYVKIEVSGEASSDLLRVEEIALTAPASGKNLLATSAGGQLVAAEPPHTVGRRLYWLVMIPGVIFTGLTLAMALLFPLKESSMREIREQLERTRREDNFTPPVGNTFPTGPLPDQRR